MLTIAQAAVGWMFLVNMELAWWEAAVLFVLFLIPFASASLARPVTYMYFAFVGFEVVRIMGGWRKPAAFTEFARLWKKYI